MSLLPPLWEQSGEEHLMKQAILTLLSSLMNALKGDSVKYHENLLPLIRNSIEPESVLFFSSLLFYFFQFSESNLNRRVSCTY